MNEWGRRYDERICLCGSVGMESRLENWVCILEFVDGILETRNIWGFGDKHSYNSYASATSHVSTLAILGATNWAAIGLDGRLCVESLARHLVGKNRSWESVLAFQVEYIGTWWRVINNKPKV